MGRRRVLAGGLGLSLALIAGCTGDSTRDGPGPSPSPSESRFDQAPSLPILPITRTPDWGSKEAGIGAISDVIFFRDVAVLSGSTRGSGSKKLIKVVDARTGKERWHQNHLKRFSDSRSAILYKPDIAVVDDGHHGLVLVHYFSSECSKGMCAPGTVEHTDEQGLAALSLEDGSVQWQHPVIPAVKAGSARAEELRDRSMQLVSGLTSVGLMITGPSDGVLGNKSVDPSTMVTIAVDPATGRRSWSRENTVASRTIDSVVLATKPSGGPEGESSDATAGPMALDSRTGKVLWSRTHDYRHCALGAVAEGSVIIQRIEEGLVSGQDLLRLTDGTTTLSLSATTPILTGDDSEPLFAASSNDNDDLLTLALGENAPVVAAHRATGVFEVGALHGGYIWGVLKPDVNTYETIAYDRSGNKLSDRIPGSVMTATDTAVITRSLSSGGSNGFDRFAVHLVKP